MRRVPLACAIVLAATGPVVAAAAEPLPDADLLEFLGSIDSDEPGWQEYLETGLRQVAARKPAPAAPPPRAPDVKDVKELKP